MLKPKSGIVALAAGATCLCGASTVSVADGYQQRAAPAYAPFSWTGLYVGVNGGYGWSNDQTVHLDETVSTGNVAPFIYASADFGSLAPAGGFGGIQAGANLQLGMVVLGAELDGHWSDIKDGSIASRLLPDGVYTLGTQNKVDRFGTARGQLGLAIDRTLIYGTAGLAWGRVSHTLNFNCCGGFPAFDQSTGTHVGYVVGGLEQMLTSRLSLKVEYQYIDLGTERYVANERFSGATAFDIITDTHTDFHTVRLGVNYKLGQ